MESNEENLFEVGLSDEEEQNTTKEKAISNLASKADQVTAGLDNLDIGNNNEKKEGVFDQDLVEAFLEMEDVLELGTYISEMDKARYKEIGYILYQAFKQRKQYEDVKHLFKTELENPMDFNNAVEIVTDILIVTGKFKVSNYVRTQLLYGLALVKEEGNSPKLSEETVKFIDQKWKMLKTDCLRKFTEVTEYNLTDKMVLELIREYEDNKKPVEAMDLVQEFELFDVDINWERGIKTLIDTQQFSKLIAVLEHKPELIKFSIDKLSNNKQVKHASKLIKNLGLDINDYPLVIERLQKKTIRYYLYNYISGPKSRDYMPLWKLEDLFNGFNSMIAFMCEDLAYKKEKRFQKDAVVLAMRNGILNELREETQAKLSSIHVSNEDMKMDCPPDKFGPLSEPAEDYVTLPSDTKVTFIGTEDEVKLMEPLLSSPSLGVD